MDSDDVVNAIIESATIVVERGFILSSYISFDYGGAGQSFGGYVLGGTAGTAAGRHEGPNFAAEWIMGVLRAAGVDNWSKLQGKAVRVRREKGLVTAIGHIVRDDRWFHAKDAFTRLGATAEASSDA